MRGSGGSRVPVALFAAPIKVRREASLMQQTWENKKKEYENARPTP